MPGEAGAPSTTKPCLVTIAAAADAHLGLGHGNGRHHRRCRKARPPRRPEFSPGDQHSQNRRQTAASDPLRLPERIRAMSGRNDHPHARTGREELGDSRAASQNRFVPAFLRHDVERPGMRTGKYPRLHSAIGNCLSRRQSSRARRSRQSGGKGRHSRRRNDSIRRNYLLPNCKSAIRTTDQTGID